VKQALFVRGEKTNEITNQILKDLCYLKKPHATFYSKKNKHRTVEDISSLEFFSRKNDHSLFAVGTHSKKRPNNLTFGRLFNHQVLDLMELGIENFTPLTQSVKQSSIGSKPCFLFVGEQFEREEKYEKLKNILIDMFRGSIVEQISLAGLDHVIICTAIEDLVYFRHYSISLKKSSSKAPRVELNDVGPSFEISFRRHQFPTRDMMKEAIAIPEAAREKKQKNITREKFGHVGRVHVGRQDLSTIATKKMKGLKRKRGER